MAKKKPCKLVICLDSDETIFKPALIGKKNIDNWVSRAGSLMVFEHLVIKNKMQPLLLILAVVGALLVIISTLFQALGLKDLYQSTILDTYILFSVFLLPILFYFGDAYQAMQLKHLLYLGQRRRSEQIATTSDNSGVNFDWNATTLAVLKQVQFGEKKRLSYAEFAELAGVKKSTIHLLLRKMEQSGIIGKEVNGDWYFSGVSFEAFRIKEGVLVPQRLSKADQERLCFLFKVLCFLAM